LLRGRNAIFHLGAIYSGAVGRDVQGP
jgi:hypothetical protein